MFINEPVETCYLTLWRRKRENLVGICMFFMYAQGEFMQSQLQPSIPQDMNILPVHFKVFTLQHIISLSHPPAYASHS